MWNIYTCSLSLGRMQRSRNCRNIANYDSLLQAHYLTQERPTSNIPINTRSTNTFQPKHLKSYWCTVRMYRRTSLSWTHTQCSRLTANLSDLLHYIQLLVLNRELQHIICCKHGRQTQSHIVCMRCRSSKRQLPETTDWGLAEWVHSQLGIPCAECCRPDELSASSLCV